MTKKIFGHLSIMARQIVMWHCVELSASKVSHFLPIWWEWKKFVAAQFKRGIWKSEWAETGYLTDPNFPWTESLQMTYKWSIYNGTRRWQRHGSSLIVSALTVMRTSQSEASEPQLVRSAAGHLRANGGSADQGLCSRQGDEWWLQSKCQNYKFHPRLTQSSSKVYLHFHIACTLQRQRPQISGQAESEIAVRVL